MENAKRWTARALKIKHLQGRKSEQDVPYGNGTSLEMLSPVSRAPRLGVPGPSKLRSKRRTSHHPHAQDAPATGRKYSAKRLQKKAKCSKQKRQREGAGAVVTKSFPEGYCVLAGNPARKVKDLDRVRLGG